MPLGTQDEVIAWLSTPAAYGSDVRAVERIDTHSATVFLAGDRAYKLKRAVRYDYLDFSTLDRRRRACEDEVRLNRRMAPDLYLGARPITRTPDGRLHLDGRGTAVDWLVEMVRFDQDGLFDRLAERHTLDVALMPGLAKAIADLHEGAERRPDQGGLAGMTWVVTGNAGAFADFGAGVFDPEAVGALTRRFDVTLARQASLLERRRRGGRVRWCHGDLHLRNVCLIEDRPTLFDAVEFNERIACGDVLYDLAFLLMDLWRRRLPAHANVVFNEYVRLTGDLDGLPLLPLFLACRAAVRAKTSATAARFQRDPARTARLLAQAREYVDLATDLLDPPPARLVAIGGPSGSGKSSLARRLAPSLGPAPGAIVVRSDVVRKALLGRDPLERLEAHAYTPDVSRRVYRRVRALASLVTRHGHAAIADARFADPGQREAIERAAARRATPFAGLWLDAPAEVLRWRLDSRPADASDATPAVLERQLERPPGEITWARLDTGGGETTVAARAARLIGLGPVG